MGLLVFLIWGEIGIDSDSLSANSPEDLRQEDRVYLALNCSTWKIALQNTFTNIQNSENAKASADHGSSSQENPMDIEGFIEGNPEIILSDQRNTQFMQNGVDFKRQLLEKHKDDFDFTYLSAGIAIVGGVVIGFAPPLFKPIGVPLVIGGVFGILYFYHEMGKNARHFRRHENLKKVDEKLYFSLLAMSVQCFGNTYIELNSE